MSADAVQAVRSVLEMLGTAHARILMLERERDNAMQGREGQLHNTLAFQAEAQALNARMDRAINILDPVAGTDLAGLLRLVRDARAVLVGNAP